jgi:hypothetical protein
MFLSHLCGQHRHGLLRSRACDRIWRDHSWARGTAFYAVWCLLFAVAGVGLLKRIRWSYSLAIGLHVFGLANGVATILSPNFERFMKDTMASMKFPAGGTNPMPEIGYMRALSSFSLLMPAVILAILVYCRSRFLEACAATHPS